MPIACGRSPSRHKGAAWNRNVSPKAQKRPRRPLSTRLANWGSLRRGVILGVGLRGFRSVVRGVSVVTVGYVGVVGRLLMVAGLMMPGGFPVMSRRVLMVFCGLRVVMRCFFRHR